MKLPAKLTVGSTFAIHPPRGGGQLRIFHLYRELARRVPVDVICLVGSDVAASDRQVAPGLREVRVPKTAAHDAAEAEVARRWAIPVTDIALPELHHLTPRFGAALAVSVAPGGAIVASHPYTLPALREAGSGAPLWYDAHNVELDLKRGMVPRGVARRRALAAVREVERACCRGAELVMAPSAQDAARLRHLYTVPEDRVLVVPNGVEVHAIRFTAPFDRRRLRHRLRMHARLALFIGSWHEPNVLAARRILKLAMQLPGVDFAIVGSVCLPMRDVERPPNVELFGVVSDEFKQSLLSVASVALNPMAEGSGTNMKMLDYLAAGVPVVSTEVGARGLELEFGRDLTIARVDAFADAVRAVLDESSEAAEVRLRAARRHVEERFAWSAVAGRLLNVLDPHAETAFGAGRASARSATTA